LPAASRWLRVYSHRRTANGPDAARDFGLALAEALEI